MSIELEGALIVESGNVISGQAIDGKAGFSPDAIAIADGNTLLISGGYALGDYAVGAGMTSEAGSGASAVGAIVNGGGVVVDGGTLIGATASGGTLFLSNGTILNGGEIIVTDAGTPVYGFTSFGATLNSSEDIVFGRDIGATVGAGSRDQVSLPWVGALVLDASTSFDGLVAGFGTTQESQTQVSFTEAAGNQSGTLTVGDGVHTAGIQLLGQYMASEFVAASDGYGGTAITLTPPPTGPGFIHGDSNPNKVVTP